MQTSWKISNTSLSSQLSNVCWLFWIKHVIHSTKKCNITWAICHQYKKIQAAKGIYNKVTFHQQNINFPCKYSLFTRSSTLVVSQWAKCWSPFMAHKPKFNFFMTEQNKLFLHVTNTAFSVIFHQVNHTHKNCATYAVGT